MCFRRTCPGCDELELDELNVGLVARLEATGHSFVSSTRLGGRYAIRMCIMNHTSSQRDVDRALDWLATATAEAPPALPADPIDRRRRAHATRRPSTHAPC